MSCKDKKDIALRFNKEKPMVDEIYPQAILEIGEVSLQGAKKYDKGNWQKGAPSTVSYGSLMRHLLKWYKGEDIDPETGCHHIAHVMWNAMAIIYNRDFHPELDDRPFVKKPETTQDLLKDIISKEKKLINSLRMNPLTEEGLDTAQWLHETRQEAMEELIERQSKLTDEDLDSMAEEELQRRVKQAEKYVNSELLRNKAFIKKD